MTGSPATAAATQRAAAYVGGRRISVVPAEVREPGPGEVRLDVHWTGICGTDLHVLHGDMDQRVTLPAVLGHEMAGRVAATGPGVEGWAAGDPVTVLPLRWCGECPACLAGHRHVCQRLVFVGIDAPGSLQHAWTVPADLLVRLPDDLRLRDGALVEPTAVAVHDVRRSGLRPGERVLVVGAGPIGLLLAAVARHQGGEVVLLEVDAHRRQVAGEMGLTALDPAAVDVASYVEDWTGGAGVAVAFDVAGVQAALDVAVRSLAVRGRLVVVAIHPAPRTLDLHRFFWRELTLAGARVYEVEDFEAAVALLHQGVLPVDVLVSSVVPLRDVADAFALLDGGGAVTKVLVDCRPDVRTGA